MYYVDSEGNIDIGISSNSLGVISATNYPTLDTARLYLSSATDKVVDQMVSLWRDRKRDHVDIDKELFYSTTDLEMAIELYVRKYSIKDYIEAIEELIGRGILTEEVLDQMNIPEEEKDNYRKEEKDFEYYRKMFREFLKKLKEFLRDIRDIAAYVNTIAGLLKKFYKFVKVYWPKIREVFNAAWKASKGFGAV